MKKVFKEIRFHFVYFIYFLITMQERNRYAMAEQRGLDCYRSEMDAFGTNYYYKPNSKPVKRYSSYKELRETYKKDGKL